MDISLIQNIFLKIYFVILSKGWIMHPLASSIRPKVRNTIGNSANSQRWAETIKNTRKNFFKIKKFYLNLIPKRISALIIRCLSFRKDSLRTDSIICGSFI